MAWYVTTLLKGNILDGPFKTREECIMRCLRMSSDEIVAKAIAGKQVNLHYVPRYIKDKDAEDAYQGLR